MRLKQLENVASPSGEIAELFADNAAVNRNSHFFVLNSKKTRIEGLIRILNDFKKECEASEIKRKIDLLIIDIQYKLEDGSSDMYTCHYTDDDGSKLEFVCVCVYKYNVGTIEACDYVLSTYSYKHSVNKGGVFLGAGLTLLGFIASFFIPLFATVMVSGAKVIIKSQNTRISLSAEKALETFYINELTNRGYLKKDAYGKLCMITES